MGMSSATAEQIGQSLAALTTKPWEAALEPVTVLYEGHNEWATSVVFEAQPAGPAAWRMDGRGWHARRRKYCSAICHLPRQSGWGSTWSVGSSLPDRCRSGHHRLEVMGDALPHGSGAATLIVAPQQAYLPEQLQRSPGIWGFGLQLYGLQGLESWGLGDFGDLSGFAAKQPASAPAL